MGTKNAARTLVRPGERRFLDPFVARERTVAEVARLLGESVERTYSRVMTLHRKGLVSVTRTQARKGRAVKFYAAPPIITAPLDLLGVTDIEGLIAAVDQPARRLFFREFADLIAQSRITRWGVRLHRDEEDRVRLDVCAMQPEWTADTLLEPDVPPVTFNWVPLRLDTPTAKSLQRELAELLGRYARRADTTPTHLLGLFLTGVRSGSHI